MDAPFYNLNFTILILQSYTDCRKSLHVYTVKSKTLNKVSELILNEQNANV